MFDLYRLTYEARLDLLLLSLYAHPLMTLRFKLRFFCSILIVSLLLVISYVYVTGEKRIHADNLEPKLLQEQAVSPAKVADAGDAVNTASDLAVLSKHAHSDGSVCSTCNVNEDPSHPTRPSIPVTVDLIQELAKQDQDNVSFTLPDGVIARGTLTRVRSDHDGAHTVSGRLAYPRPGYYSFHRQLAPSVVGPMSGDIVFDEGQYGYSIDVTPEGGSVLVKKPVNEIRCDELPLLATANADEYIPEDHLDLTEPSYQNSVPLLESLRGATGVIYLDFDGEYVDYYWDSGNPINAVSRNFSDSKIRQIWERVAEDFAPFNLNVTTDLQVYLAAPSVSRQQCVITSTKTAAPDSGGVANYNSFNETDDKVCWVFNSGTSSCAETISHEIGHTLYLYHDGRSLSDGTETYYGGHGSSPVRWAPIMGASFNKDITQWSKGEYADANQSQDDLARIVSRTNVDYRVDDHGSDFATSSYLNIFPDNSVSSQGIITETGEFDAFRFTMKSTGNLNLSIDPIRYGPNMDILAEILDSGGNVLHSANPDSALDASFSAISLTAGDYFLRISATGRGDALGDGYTNYATLGHYEISGSITGAEIADRFSVEELSPNGTFVGTVTPGNDHGTDPLTFDISSTSRVGAFTFIDENSADLTIADLNQLIYLDLATRYDVPAEVELLIGIMNSSNPSLNETVRVVVTVTEFNDAPIINNQTISGEGTYASGATIGSVVATDPDYVNGILSFAITSGNDLNIFSIDSSGLITTNAILDYYDTPSYSFTVTVTDNGSPELTDMATIVLELEPYNNVPVADAGEDQILVDSDGNGTELVNLDGSLSSDLETDAEDLSYEWTDLSDPAVVLSQEVSPTISLASGSYTIQLKVTDEGNESAIDTVSIAIQSFYNPVGYIETFEASTVGSLNGQIGWEVTGSGSAIVQSSIIHAGSQAALIQDAILSRPFEDAPRELVVSFFLKPDVQTSTATIRLDDAVEFSLSSTGQFSAYNSGSLVTLNSPFFSDQWSEFEIVCNYPAQTWGLSANGTVLFSDFSFKSNQVALDSIEFEAVGMDAFYLDDLEITVPAPEANLHAYWAFDDDADEVALTSLVEDVSGSGYHGTYVGGTWVSGKQGGALDFNQGSDSVELPSSAFEAISNEITIAMWVYGDTTQARADSVFYAVNAGGARLLNIHLPWSNSVVYWDAGYSGTSYDRLNKTANASDFKGQWNQWVFTKNASTGSMNIYLNGVLWSSATGKTKPMSGITEAFISGNGGSNRYDGIIDEVKLYNVAKSATEIEALYNRYSPSLYTIEANYSSWLIGSPELVDVSFTGDPEGDGIETGLEYVLNGDPMKEDSIILPQADASGNHFVFTFNRLVASAQNTTQIFQYSSDFSTWEDVIITAPTDVRVTLGVEENGMQLVTVTISKDEAVGDQLFGRLNVSEN